MRSIQFDPLFTAISCTSRRHVQSSRAQPETPPTRELCVDGSPRSTRRRFPKFGHPPRTGTVKQRGRQKTPLPSVLVSARPTKSRQVPSNPALANSLSRMANSLSPYSRIQWVAPPPRAPSRATDSLAVSRGARHPSPKWSVVVSLPKANLARCLQMDGTVGESSDGAQSHRSTVVSWGICFTARAPTTKSYRLRVLRAVVR